jgi:hypothetical protein
MPLRIALQTKLEGCPPWQPIFTGGSRLCQTNQAALSRGENERRRSVALHVASGLSSVAADFYGWIPPVSDKLGRAGARGK